MKHLAYAGFFATAASVALAQQDTLADETAMAADDAAIAETEPDASGAGPEPAPEPDVMAIVSASETSLDAWRWLRRPVIVFADSAADPRYVEQMGLITERLSALEERDVVVITDTDPAARSSVRQTLRARGFMLVIMAKDGTIVTRKPAPWDVREISRSIDKLPLRQQEIRDRREALQ